MIRIREAIIVEGRYDKNTLAQVVDAPILETSGFGIFHTNENPQGDQHGVFHLFPNGYAKCKSGEVELEGIQFEHHHRQHNKQTQRQQFCQCRHQVNAGSGLHPAQDQKVNNPQ